MPFSFLTKNELSFILSNPTVFDNRTVENVIDYGQQKLGMSKQDILDVSPQWKSDYTNKIRIEIPKWVA